MADYITSKKPGINFIVTKLHLLIPIIFLIFTAFIAFVIDNPSQDGDLLYYYFAGNEILYGDKENSIQIKFDDYRIKKNFQIVKFDDINNWLAVKNDYISAEEAEIFFLSFFKIGNNYEA